MFDLGAPELLIILLVVLVIFGGAKIPKLARSLGQAQKEFKSGLDEGHKDERQPRTTSPPPELIVPLVGDHRRFSGPYREPVLPPPSLP